MRNIVALNGLFLGCLTVWATMTGLPVLAGLVGVAAALDLIIWAVMSNDWKDL